MSSAPSFTLASRKSPLAVRQATLVRARLADAIGLSAGELETHLTLKTFVTQGDKRLAGSLAEIGGKGLFTKEIEFALLNGDADIAIHSMKDMPAQMPDGLVTAAIPAREDARDAFISGMASSPWELPENAVFGTSSVRRAAQLLHRRPDLKIVPLRGNVDRRLEKLAAGEADATLLAEAGLRRLDKSDVQRTVLEPQEMLPAVGQGVLCVQMRADDDRLGQVRAALSCRSTTLASAAERAFLERLDGSCQTPIAGLAVLDGPVLSFSVQLLSLDGRDEISLSGQLTVSDEDDHTAKAAAVRFGAEVAEKIFAKAPANIRELVRAA